MTHTTSTRTPDTFKVQVLVNGSWFEMATVQADLISEALAKFFGHSEPHWSTLSAVESATMRLIDGEGFTWYIVLTG